jgi:TonB family protein
MHRLTAIVSAIVAVTCASRADADTPATVAADDVAIGHMLPGPDLQSKCPYPAEAAKAHVEGETRLRVTLDAAGIPTNAEVSGSSGSAQLDSAAVECVKKERFAPIMRNAVAVPGTGEVVWKWALPAASPRLPNPLPLQTCKDSLPDPHAARNWIPPGLVGTLTIRPPPAVSSQVPDGASTVVCLCDDASGKLSGEPVLSISSGNSLLDQGTLGFARGLPFPPNDPGCLLVRFVVK